MDIQLDQIDPPKYLLRTVKTWHLDFLLLRDSIKTDGILVPLLVRPKGDRYELVDGAHRFECASQLGLKVVPCNVMELSDSEACLKQIQANSLYIPTSKYDFARHLKAILKMDPSLTVDRLAAAIFKPVNWVRKVLSLTRLDHEVAEQVKTATLKNQLELAKLPFPLQRESVDACLALTGKEFKNYVSQLLRNEKEAFAYESKVDKYSVFNLKPQLRSLQKIEKELEYMIACQLLVSEKDSGKVGWKKALQWVLHQDSVSQQEYIEKTEKQLQLKKRKLAKRKKYEY